LEGFWSSGREEGGFGEIGGGFLDRGGRRTSALSFLMSSITLAMVVAPTAAQGSSPALLAFWRQKGSWAAKSLGRLGASGSTDLLTSFSVDWRSQERRENKRMNLFSSFVFLCAVFSLFVRIAGLENVSWRSMGGVEGVGGSPAALDS